MARLGKRGFIFTLDIAIAFTIFVLFLVLISYLFSRAPEDPAVDVQMQRVANDIITVMDKSNSLQTFDKSKIEDSLKSLAPPQYGMLLTVKKYKLVDLKFDESGGDNTHHNPCNSDADCGNDAPICCNAPAHKEPVCEPPTHHNCGSGKNKIAKLLSAFNVSTETNGAQLILTENHLVSSQRTFIDVKKDNKDAEYGLVEYYLWLK